MIFVTVGTQLPYDRLVRTVDEWAGRTGRTDVFAQVGPTKYRPRHIECAPFVPADECRRRMKSATAVVAHAGMGSVLTALELGKPIVVMPRRADLGEHRNDHQMATARRLLAMGRVIVAFDEEHLVAKLAQLDHLRAGSAIPAMATPQLIHVLRDFIAGCGQPCGTRRPDREPAVAAGERFAPRFVPASADAFMLECELAVQSSR